jgi:hypothetical protein
MERRFGPALEAYRQTRLRRALPPTAPTLIVHVREDNETAAQLCDLLGAGRAERRLLCDGLHAEDAPLLLIWSAAAAPAAEALAELAAGCTRPVTLCAMDAAPVPPELAAHVDGSLHMNVFVRAVARTAVH